jgi:hypothetical protein
VKLHLLNAGGFLQLAKNRHQLLPKGIAILLGKTQLDTGLLGNGQRQINGLFLLGLNFILRGLMQAIQGSPFSLLQQLIQVAQKKRQQNTYAQQQHQGKTQLNSFTYIHPVEH